MRKKKEKKHLFLEKKHDFLQDDKNGPFFSHFAKAIAMQMVKTIHFWDEIRSVEIVQKTSQTMVCSYLMALKVF